VRFNGEHLSCWVLRFVGGRLGPGAILSKASTAARFTSSRVWQDPEKLQKLAEELERALDERKKRIYPGSSPDTEK
jgi:hypothetical protein